MQNAPETYQFRQQASHLNDSDEHSPTEADSGIGHTHACTTQAQVPAGPDSWMVYGKHMLAVGKIGCTGALLQSHAAEHQQLGRQDCGTSAWLMMYSKSCANRRGFKVWVTAPRPAMPYLHRACCAHKHVVTTQMIACHQTDHKNSYIKGSSKQGNSCTSALL